MSYFTKEILARWTRGEWINDRLLAPIKGFSIDSRNVDNKEMFIALRTENRDGHQFLTDAERRGATAALTEQEVSASRMPQLKVKRGVTALQDIAHNHRKLFGGTVIGITGSCGKTSTKDLLSVLLGEARVLKTAGNLNNHLGVPLTLLRLNNGRHDWGVVEAGINSAGEMSQLASIIDAEVGIVTMVGRAHLELLKSLDGVAREKSSLLREGKRKDFIVYPSSCLQYGAFQDLDETRNLVVCPIGSKLELSQSQEGILYWCVVDSLGQWTLSLKQSNGIERKFEIPNMSPGMRQNVALSIVTAGELGVSDEMIQKRIKSWYPSSNRGQIFATGKNWIYSDCYNANPDSMKDSLKAFEGAFDRNLNRMFVLGSMYELGEKAEQYHREIASLIDLRDGDKAIFVGPYAKNYCEGLSLRSHEDGDILCAENIGDVQEQVERFKGAIFLKGSRGNRLESVIPEGSEPIALETGKLC